MFSFLSFCRLSSLLLLFIFLVRGAFYFCRAKSSLASAFAHCPALEARFVASNFVAFLLYFEWMPLDDWATQASLVTWTLGSGVTGEDIAKEEELHIALVCVHAHSRYDPIILVSIPWDIRTALLSFALFASFTCDDILATFIEARPYSTVVFGSISAFMFFTSYNPSLQELPILFMFFFALLAFLLVYM